MAVGLSLMPSMKYRKTGEEEDSKSFLTFFGTSGKISKLLEMNELMSSKFRAFHESMHSFLPLPSFLGLSKALAVI